MDKITLFFFWLFWCFFFLICLLFFFFFFFFYAWVTLHCLQACDRSAKTPPTLICRHPLLPGSGHLYGHDWWPWTPYMVAGERKKSRLNTREEKKKRIVTFYDSSTGYTFHYICRGIRWHHHKIGKSVYVILNIFLHGFKFETHSKHLWPSDWLSDHATTNEGPKSSIFVVEEEPLLQF